MSEVNDQVAPAAPTPTPAPATPDTGAPAPTEADAPRLPTEIDPESEQALRDEKVKQHRFKDDTRTKIFARHREHREEEVASHHAHNPDQASLAEAIATGAELEYDAEGNPVRAKGAPATAAAPAGAAPGAAAAPAPAPGVGKKYKITVYGEPVREAEEEEVIRYGVAAIQKDAAVDVRMRQASDYEANLRTYAGQLQKIADNLAQGRDADGNPITTAPTPTGAAGVVDEAKVQKAFDLVSDGKPDEASKILAEVVRDAVAAGRVDTTPKPGATGAVPPKVPTLPVRRSFEELTACNTVFETEYAELLADDATLMLAQELMGAKLADPRNAGRQADDLAREVGNTVRRVPKTGAPGPAAPTPTPAAEAIEQRRTLKARVALTPPVATGRSGGPVGEPRFPTAADYVQQLRKRSGANSAR